MSDTKHEYCEHGICLKCEGCVMCSDIKKGRQAAFKIIDELLAQRSRKD